MKNKTFIKCSNCSGTDFEPTTIGEILSTEGNFYVNAYACQKCGHIELFDPDLDLFAQQKREELSAQKQREKLEQQKKEEVRQKRVKELKEIINNEDMTVRQVNAAKQELKALGVDGDSIVKVIGNSPCDVKSNTGITIIGND